MTADGQRVRERLAAHGLITPDYGPGGGLGSVLVAAAASLGVELRPEAGPEGSEAARRLGLAPTERVCVVLVDGLGHRNLLERSGHAPFLRSLSDRTRVLTSAFPSTTAASMALFGTGCPPGQTGLLGYTIRHPLSGGPANLVSWRDAPDPAWLQRRPTVFEALIAAAVPATAVGPERFAASGLTLAALRGAEYRPAERLSARVDVAVAALRRPGLVYLYWAEVDTVGHRLGCGSAEWGDAVTDLDAELARLVRSVPRGTTVLITADHGMVDPAPALRADLAELPDLRTDVALLTGEPRARHVHLNTGVDPAAAAGRWSERLGGRAVVLTGDQAIDAGLLGPVAGHVRSAVGDLVVLAVGGSTLVDSRTEPASALAMVGAHGSLTPAEVEVPLVVVDG